MPSERKLRKLSQELLVSDLEAELAPFSQTWRGGLETSPTSVCGRPGGIYTPPP
jgi:hypothetical protein